jgi:hypothetical protein
MGMCKMNRNLKSAAIYFFTAVFAFAFDRIYAIFSHGVSSEDMSSVWIFLLCSGTLFYTALHIISAKTKYQPKRFACNIYNSGTAVFAVGMLLKGVFDIAGTGSDFILFYRIAGIVLMSAGAVLIVFFLRKKN